MSISFLIAFNGCHKIAGNHPYFGYLLANEADGELRSADYVISITDKTFRDTTSAERLEFSSSEEVRILVGSNAPRYILSAPEGYEGVIAHISTLTEDKDSPYCSAFGTMKDGILYGFVNLYHDTIGFLSGGGNLGVEEIAYSVTFYYNPTGDVFTLSEKIQEALIVARSEKTTIFLRDKKYYSFDSDSGAEKFLVDDKAYDSGIQHQSHTQILSNGKYAVIDMTKEGYFDSDRYVYVYDYENNLFFELTEKKVI